jgi:hypothetical protein
MNLILMMLLFLLVLSVIAGVIRVFRGGTLLVAMVLLVLPFQMAHGEVTEDVRYGPTCQYTHCALHVKLEGVITVRDYEKLKSLIDKTRVQGERQNLNWVNVFVYVDSPGGSVDAAMAIGRLLRKEEAYVSIGYRPLLSQGVCYSACVLVFAGAVRRDMDLGRVGIHRPYLEVPKDAVSPEKVRDIFQKTLHDICSYFREMNVSEQLADAMLRIEPENMRLLNDAALASYGLTYEDPIARETKELQIAQKYGLSRQEYMRRKALAMSRCTSPTTFCAQKIIETGRADPRVSPDEEDFRNFVR